MARIIKKDPNHPGKYRVWSTIVDGWILEGATPENIIDLYVEDYRETITRDVQRQIEQLDELAKEVKEFEQE